MMAELPQGFYDEDIYCFPIGTDKHKTFSVIPGTPSIQQQSQPSVTLTLNPNGAEFALTAVWSIPENRWLALQHACEKYAPLRAPAVLRMAEMELPQVSLQFQSQSRTLCTIGPVPSSGMGQFQAVLRANLNPEEKDLVNSAFRGQRGLLLLSYETVLPLSSQAQLTASGDIAFDLKVLAPAAKKGIFGKEPIYPTLEECKTQATKSLDAQRIDAVWDNTPNVSETLAQKVKADIIGKIADELYRTIQELGPGAGSMTKYNINFTSQGSESHRFPIRRVLDLGDWFHCHPEAQSGIQNIS